MQVMPASSDAFEQHENGRAQGVEMRSGSGGWEELRDLKTMYAPPPCAEAPISGEWEQIFVGNGVNRVANVVLAMSRSQQPWLAGLGEQLSRSPPPSPLVQSVIPVPASSVSDVGESKKYICGLCRFISFIENSSTSNDPNKHCPRDRTRSKDD